jgi:putative transposase
MSKYIHKRHNVFLLVYHCPTKYRRVVFTQQVTDKLGGICVEISERYEIHFLEIGTDRDHTHFLIQSVPMYSPKQIVQITKSITGRQLFKWEPALKRQSCEDLHKGTLDCTGMSK